MMDDEEIMRHIDAAETRVHEHLRGFEKRIMQQLRSIMSDVNQTQVDVDTATQVLTGLVGDVNNQSASLNTIGSALQQWIDDHPNVDTTGLDSIVGQVGTAQSALDTSVNNVNAVIPVTPAPTPPAGP
jgi:hypothetical protein